MADHVDGRTPSSDSILLRTFSWGTAAALALGAFVFTAQSDEGSTRLQLALAGSLASQPQIVAALTSSPPTAGEDPGLKALQSKLDRLDSERVRIDARLTNVEQGLQDVTGSIRRQTDVHAPAPPAARLPFIEPPVFPALGTLPAASVQASTAPAETPPAEAPPAAVEAATTDVTALESVPAETPAVPADVPVPRARPHHSALHPEYGIELGTAVDLQALQSRWVAIKANFGPLLVGLSPVVMKDPRPGSTQLRLIAGPLKSMAAARELCARFVAENGYCWPRKINATDIVQR